HARFSSVGVPLCNSVIPVVKVLRHRSHRIGALPQAKLTDPLVIIFCSPGALMATLTQAATRTEKDSLGTKQIPSHVYYGIQTARAVENYPISGMRAHPKLIRAFGMVKEAAAEANRDLGL